MSKERKKLSWSNVHSMPNDKYGVYGFWYKVTGRCIYIGKAQKQPIRTRVKQHLQNCHSKKLRLWLKGRYDDLEICHIVVSSEEDQDKVRTLEKQLIQKFNPQVNEALKN